MNNCISKTKNTASSRCKFDWGLFQRVIVTPKDEVFTGLDAGGQSITFDEWIMKGIHAKNRQDRFYPMPLFSGVTNNSEDAKSWTNEYGQKFVLMEGNKAFEQSYNQDYCLSNKLATFNDGMARRVIIFDNKGLAWLVSKGDNAEGFEAHIYCHSAGINTPSELVEPKIEYTMKHPNDFINKVAFETDLDITSIEGLEDVEMIVEVGTTNTTIKFVSDCGNFDVTAEMQGISAKKSCWLLDGEELATAPTYQDGVFTIATSGLGNNKTLSLATPDVLYSNGVTFKECAVGVKLSIS